MFRTSNRSRTPRRRLAFTLVELLVVIGIIALLIGILLPTLSRAREASKMVVCLSNQRQMGNSIVMFTNEHNNYLPKAWFNAAPDWEGNGTTNTWGFQAPAWGWDYVIVSFNEGGKEIFRCPSDDSNVIRGEQFNPALYEPIGIQPEDDDIPASYRINISNQPGDGGPDAYKVTQLLDFTKSIYIAEGNPSGYHHFATFNGLKEQGMIAPRRLRNVDEFRHGDELKFNFLFADGHAEALKWEDTFKPIGGEVTFEARNGSTQTAYPTMWRQLYSHQSRIDFYKAGPGKP